VQLPLTFISTIYILYIDTTTIVMYGVGPLEKNRGYTLGSLADDIDVMTTERKHYA
jgi:hypothetical protein